MSLSVSYAQRNRSIQFFGTGPDWAGDPYCDRIRVLIDAGSGNPSLPANIGGGDFTVEAWLYAYSSADDPSNYNSAGSITAGAHNDWINGNIWFDRDRFGQNRAFGSSLAAGRVAFGTYDANSVYRTIVGSQDIRGSWWHVALTRDISAATNSIFVGQSGTGVRDATSSSSGTGSLAYPNGATPNSSCGVGGSQVCDESDPYMVFGAEKHDAGGAYPSFFGLMRNMRVSSSIRYSGTTYTVPSGDFLMDSDTVWLANCKEQSGVIVRDLAFGNHGVMEVGGPSSGPQRSTRTNF